MLEICPLSDLPPGKLRRVPTDRLIAGFHTEDGDVFAIDDTYAHQDASLADGWLDSTAGSLGTASAASNSPAVSDSQFRLVIRALLKLKQWVRLDSRSEHREIEFPSEFRAISGAMQPSESAAPG